MKESEVISIVSFTYDSWERFITTWNDRDELPKELISYSAQHKLDDDETEALLELVVHELEDSNINELRFKIKTSSNNISDFGIFVEQLKKGKKK